jgi:uncharacterized protein YaiI (UPF0178 family)
LVISIYVYADACRSIIKKTLYYISQRTGIRAILVANRPLSIPRIPSVKSIQLGQRYYITNHHIVALIKENDLVITVHRTMDYNIIDKGELVLNPRGATHSKTCINVRLNMREFLDFMRNSGIQFGGDATPLSHKDPMDFCNTLGRCTTKYS